MLPGVGLVSANSFLFKGESILLHHIRNSRTLSLYDQSTARTEASRVRGGTVRDVFTGINGTFICDGSPDGYTEETLGCTHSLLALGVVYPR